MNITKHSESFDYNPNHLLNTVLNILDLKSDAALSRVLGVSPPVISKIRHFRLPVGAWILIRLHEVTGWSIKDLRALMGDHRETFTSPKLDLYAAHQHGHSNKN